MSLEINLQNLVTRIATEFKSIRSVIGNTSNLSTSQKADLVSALNGLQTDLGKLQTAQQNATSINDSSTGNTTTWSSQKTQQAIADAVAALVNGAPSTLDTLKELADQLAKDESGVTAISNSLANKVDVSVAQSFTATQQQQGRDNIGAVAATAIGNTEHNYVTDFNNALQ